MQNDLICIFTSWYHLLGITSYLESLPRKPNNIIYIQGTFFDKKVDISRVPLGKYCNNYFILNKTDSLRDSIRALDNRTNRMTIVTAINAARLSLILYREGILHDVVRTEEGLGSYSDSLQMIKGYVLLYRKQYKASLIKSLSKALIYRLSNLFHTALVRHKCWLLFDAKSLKERTEVALHHKIALESITANVKPTIFNDSHVTIFISSPLVEIGKIDNKRFSRILDEIRISASKGRTLYIKPHPIEDLSKYTGMNVVAPNVPLEQLLLWNKNRNIKLIGFTTTSLYTSNVLFGIRPSRLVSHDDLYRTLSRKQKLLIDSNCDLHFLERNQ